MFYRRLISGMTGAVLATTLVAVNSVHTTVFAEGLSEVAVSSRAGASPVDDVWAEVVAAANAEGEVRLYVANTMIDSFLIDGFSLAYPDIELVIYRETTAGLMTRLSEELSAGADGADVAIHSSRAWFDDLGNTQPLPAGPNAESWQSLESFSENYFTPWWFTNVNGWNTDLVPGGVSDIEDFLTPEYRGRIGIIDPSVADTVIDWYLAMEQIYGDDFLERLAAVEPRIYPASTPVGQAVGAGELLIGSGATGPAAFESVRLEGAPVAYQVPDRGIIVNTGAYYAAVVSNANRPNAGAVFLDWLMSVEGQTALAFALAGTMVSPVYDDIEGQVDLDIDDPAVAVFDRYTPYPDDFRNEFLTRFDDIFR